jgi:hypothetical protein
MLSAISPVSLPIGSFPGALTATGAPTEAIGPFTGVSTAIISPSTGVLTAIVGVYSKRLRGVEQGSGVEEALDKDLIWNI